MKRILVAVDFSEASVDALKQAITIAKKFEAQLFVLHVIHDPANSPGFYISKKAGKEVFRNMEESARQMMAKFSRKHWKKFKDYGTFVIHGLPGAQIINFAEKKKVDLIVMGTHRRGGLNHLMLGSVADKVIRSATCAVLVGRKLQSKKNEQGNTAQLIAFKITHYALLIIAVGFISLFVSKNDVYRVAGKALLGFGIVFPSIHIMSETMYPFRTYQ